MNPPPVEVPAPAVPEAPPKPTPFAQHMTRLGAVNTAISRLSRGFPAKMTTQVAEQYAAIADWVQREMGIDIKEPNNLGQALEKLRAERDRLSPKPKPRKLKIAKAEELNPPPKE